MDKKLITNNSTYLVISIIISVALLVLGGLLAFLLKYYSLYSRISEQVNKNPLQQQAVDLTQLDREYQTKSQAITSAYFENWFQFFNEGKLAEETEKVRDELLSLKVTAEAKAKHLAMVLMLEEIKRLAQDGNQEKISQKIEEFKKLVNTNTNEIKDSEIPHLVNH